MKNSLTDDFNYKWGEIKLEKLPAEVDVQRLKQLKPIIVDEPLLPNILYPDLGLFTQLNKPHKSHSSKNLNQNTNKFRPSIDSYIINTIKLNQLLKDQIPFEQVNFFHKPKKRKSKKSSKLKKHLPIINSDQDARHHLKEFIKIMSLHTGFNEASSLALDTLVDVLDHFLESFFKLLKNLQNIHQFDVNSDEHMTTNCYYSTENFVEQALQESGFGTIQEIKEFYINDIILYYRDTYKKVSKLYQEYKAKKQAEKTQEKNKNHCLVQDTPNLKPEHDIHLEEFMRDNDFLNDESNSILGELLTDLNVSHLDDDMNKLLSIIGHDPFSLITDEFNAIPDNPDTNQ